MKQNSSLSKGNAMSFMSFLIVFSLISLSQQSCQMYKDSLELCYQMENSNFIFVNCSRTVCTTNNNSNSPNCTSPNVTHYNEIDCLNQLCPSSAFGTLSTCINQLQGGNAFTNKTLQIVCSIIGAIVGVSLILLLSYFLYRRFSQKKLTKNHYHSTSPIKARQDNSFMAPSIEISIVQIPSISSNINITDSVQNNKALENQADSVENDPAIIQMGYVNNQIINQPCCICLSTEQINCLTMCNHFYHAKCISQWMKKQESCPTCRSKNFTPVKIFCSQCGKVRDVFKFIHKRYACFSKIDVNFYSTSTLCHKCHQSDFSAIEENKISEKQVQSTAK